MIKPYFLENRHVILIGIVSLIIVDFLQLFIPRILKWAVDDLTTFKADISGLTTCALLIAGIGILIGCFRYLWRRCLIGTSRRVEESLRNKLFGHIQTLSASYFIHIRTGDLMAHATNDIQHVRMAMGMGMVALTDAVVLGAAAIGFMVYINVRLTLFVIIPMPLIVLGTRFFSKKMHRLYQQVQGNFSVLTEVVREHFAGIRIIKAYGWETESSSKLVKTSKNYITSNIRLVRVTGSFFPMMLLFSNLSLAIVLFLGGRQTITATITPGDFVAFISYLGLLTWPMMAMGWVTNLIQRGSASLDRINKILTTQSEITDRTGAIPIKQALGRISIENVSFSYNSKTGPVLSKIDIKIGPAQVLGIVGPPGSGKSTLTNLIPRVFDVSEGRILLDGTDIRNITIQSLRDQIAFMAQEPFLFSGSILENISFGNQDVAESKLIQAVKAASLYDTINAFPDGFNTIVGEKGIVLSGGQKQRIALARALLQTTPILILDDPISQVDVETGSIIIKALKTATADKTIIIVSHRLEAVRFADKIVALEDGRIVESGTHSDLMANNRYYAKTFRLQELEEEFNAD